jgi:hypothetical protein
MRKILTLIVVAVSGCAAPVYVLSDEERQQLAQPVECRGAEPCSALWRRVQAWVARNSGYKIQTASDAIVQTFNAQDYSTSWAMQVVREPVGNGVERLSFSASCGRAPICGQSADQVRARFHREMR